MKNNKETLRYMTTAGIYAALITIMTAYLFHIPVGLNGGYLHFGDMLIYLCATMLPTPYAAAAAAIGGGLADLFTAPMWAPATVIIKALLVVPFTNNSGKIICKRNVAAAILGFVTTGVGYYFAEKIIFGGYVAFLASVTGSLVQSGGSLVLFLIVGTVLDRVHFRAKTGLSYCR